METIDSVINQLKDKYKINEENGQTTIEFSYSGYNFHKSKNFSFPSKVFESLIDEYIKKGSASLEYSYVNSDTESDGSCECYLDQYHRTNTYSGGFELKLKTILDAGIKKPELICTIKKGYHEGEWK